jgi:hypothetical protein
VRVEAAQPRQTRAHRQHPSSSKDGILAFASVAVRFLVIR